MSSSKKRQPGRPLGSKNKTHKPPKEQSSRLPGRPKGSRNKKGVKIRKPSKIDAAYLYQTSSGAKVGQGNISELIQILQTIIKDQWTEDRVLAFFGENSTPESRMEFENNCHFYSSSKGRLIAGNHHLDECELFPGLDLTEAFLLHYIHSYDDVLTYGEFVTTTCKELRNRALLLEETSE